MHPLVDRLSLVPGRPSEDGPVVPWRAGAVAVLWSIATSLVPLVLVVLTGWLASGLLGGLADPVRLAVDIWLTAHGVPLALSGGGALTLHPLGLTLLVLALLWRAGRWAGRNAAPASFADAGRLTAMIAVGYGAVTTLLALAGTGPAARPDVVVAAGAGILLSAVLGGLGVLSGSGLLPVLRTRIPLVWRVAIDAGAGAALVLGGLAAVLLVGVLLVQRDTAYDLAVAVGPDTVGWPLLLLLNVLLVPNAVLAALAYAVGPGFAVGVGTSVTIGGSQVAALPPLSLFAAVPGAANPSPATYAVLAIPLLAGIAAGLLAVRRSATLRPELCALAGLAAGPVAGALTMLAAWAASGGLGAGRLASIGPTAWLVGAVVTVEVGVVAAATAWVGCPRSRSAAVPDVTPLTVATTSALDEQSPLLPVPVADVPLRPLAVAPVAVAAQSGELQPAVEPSAGDGDDEPTVMLVRPSRSGPANPPPTTPDAAATHDPDDGEETVVLERHTG